jgi:4-hydroxy-tetrahydrodipicolinate synthase
MTAPFVPAVKAALSATGFAIGNPRPPISPLDPQLATAISRLAAPLSRATAVA